MAQKSSIGVGVFAFFILVGAGCSGESSTTGDNSTGVLEGALSFDKAMTCEWTSPDGSGTSYIKGEKVRTDVTASAGSSTILAVDDCAYIWEEGAADGLRFCYSSDVEGDDPFGYENYDEEIIASAEGTDEDPDLDMNCRNTNLSDDLFVPPSNVNFSNPLEDLGF